MGGPPLPPLPPVHAPAGSSRTAAALLTVLAAAALLLTLGLAGAIAAAACDASLGGCDHLDLTGGFTVGGVSYAHPGTGLRRLAAHGRRWAGRPPPGAVVRSRPGNGPPAWQLQPAGSGPPFTVFVTFANWEWETARRRLVREAEASGAFNASIGYQISDLDPAFYARHRRVFEAPRGYGYWLWKPYFLLQTLEQMRDGDVLLYADAGCALVGDPRPWLALAARHGALAFQLEHAMEDYTKADCFVALDMPRAVWGRTPQLVGGIMALQRRPATLAFVREWLEWCTHYDLISDSPSLAPNAPTFAGHRHEQSIFSLLAYKRNLTLLLPDATWPADTATVVAAGRYKDRPERPSGKGRKFKPMAAERTEG